MIVAVIVASFINENKFVDRLNAFISFADLTKSELALTSTKVFHHNNNIEISPKSSWDLAIKS